MNPLTAKKIFLMDAFGALLSALFLIAILMWFNEYVNMPTETLSILSAIAVAFCVYSTLCFFLVKTRPKPFLRIIITANVLYGCLTIGLLMVHYAQVTALGLTYFVLEIIVIAIIVFIEIKATQT
jgi:hypothetical protein